MRDEAIQVATMMAGGNQNPFRHGWTRMDTDFGENSRRIYLGEDPHYVSGLRYTQGPGQCIKSAPDLFVRADPHLGSGLRYTQDSY